jgi:hypothetical protein
MTEVNADNRQQLIASFANWYVDSCTDLDLLMHLAEKQVRAWFDGLTDEQVAKELDAYEFSEDSHELPPV